MSTLGKKITSRYIGCFSDIHLGLGQDSKNWHKIALDFAKWASKYYEDKHIDEIIICGDIFHNRSEISVETLSVAKEFFDYFKNFSAVYILAGNHDSYYKENSLVNSIALLDGWNNIHIIDKTPLVLETNYPKKLSLIPWGTEIDNMPKVDMMFGHFEISSFYMNSYKMCEHGMSSANLFNVAKYVVSGHFHKKDHRSYDNGEIIYVGSPYQQNFGDAHDQRGIYIIDLSNNNFEFIENTISPKHIKLSINGDGFDNEELIKNNFISLVIDEKIDQEKVLSIQAKIAACNPLNLRLDYDKPEEKIESNDEEKDYSSSDLWKNIEEYIETLDIENKKDVVDYVKNLYNTLS
jgi:DNA repair exonuclease SbcCD nuclease subunit